MSHRVDNERIERFRWDRNLLPYDNIVIARRMGIDKSNYSKAIKTGPITNAFLKKFYAAFEEELKDIKKQFIAEPDHVYPASNNSDKTIDVLSERLNHLLRKYDQLIEENQKTLADIRRLEQKTDKILVDRLDKIEKLLIHIGGGRRSARNKSAGGGR